ncbi:DNA-directed DNA polymerase, partial [Powellomyces hirtus]
MPHYNQAELVRTQSFDDLESLQAAAKRLDNGSNKSNLNNRFAKKSKNIALEAQPSKKDGSSHKKTDAKKTNDLKRKNFPCWLCNLNKHTPFNCPRKTKAVEALKPAANANIAEAHNAVTLAYLDSGCSQHMTNDISILESYEEHSTRVRFGNNAFLDAEAKGNATLKLSDGDVPLTDVLYVPKLAKTLISVSALAKDGKRVTFEDESAVIQDCNGTTNDITIPLVRGMYHISPTPMALVTQTCSRTHASSPPTHALENTSTKSNKASTSVRATAASSASSGAGSGPLCPVNKGTLWHHRLGHPGAHIMRKLKLPMASKVCRGCECGKHKCSPFNGTITRFKTPLNGLHFDLNGPHTSAVGNEKYALVVIDDYSRFRWIFFLKAKSESTAKLIEFINFIENQTNEWESCIQSNSVAERFNLTLFDTIRSLEHSYGILKQLWTELPATSVYLRNCLPHKSNNNISLYEQFNGKEPALTHLRVLWADAFVHLVKRKQVLKLAPCATCLKLIGYEFDGAYRCWDDNCQEIVISCDVTIDEASALELAKAYIPPEELYEVQEILDSRDGPEGPEFLCKWLGFKDEDNTWEPIENVNHLTVFADYINEKTAIALSAASTKEPQTYKQALSSDDAPKWTEAINAELKSLHTHDTWEVIDPKTLPHNQRPIRTKWVFKIKQDLDGFEHRYSIDYNKTYAPVAKIATQHILLALAASLGLKCHQMDVVMAFLNGTVTEMILIYAPKGSGFPPGTILRLRKALYGLKQAPRECDSSQYISVYVDDLLIFAKNESEISSIKASLHNKFNMTDLGKVNHYLGMR